MEQDFHSTHCDKCFSFAHCNKVRTLRKSRGEDEIPCPIIFCRLKCGHQFHECKRTEHELLCPKAKAPCINKEFGCPLEMERANRGPHLETCPASVIVCSMEWNRWPLAPGKEQPFQLNPSQLDVASTLRDQRTLSEWKENVPPTLRYLLKSNMNDRAVMPLGVSGLRIPKSILNQAIIEQNLKIEAADHSESEQDDSFSDSPWGWKKCPPGLQESVCNKLKSLNVAQEKPNHQNEFSFNTMEEGERKWCYENRDASNASEFPDAGEQGWVLKDAGWVWDWGTDGKNSELNGAVKPDIVRENGFKPKQKKNVEFSLMVEVKTKCTQKNGMYTFMCGREFRRDEYPSHFSHIHSKIHTQLNGWLYMRCPLAFLGCTFGLERMHPNDENYNVVYHPVADAFCFTQGIPGTVDLPQNGLSVHEVTNEKTDENIKVSLSSLPFELLVHITRYLDPLSLNSLSLTNRLFRDACSCVVVERGIVVLHWEKKNDGLSPGWEITEKKWIFSTAFSPIEKWKFGDVGRMINHMKICPYFERNVPTKPFAYPITKEQLLVETTPS